VIQRLRQLVLEAEREVGRAMASARSAAAGEHASSRRAAAAESALDARTAAWEAGASTDLSAQPAPFMVTEVIAFVQCSVQPEPFLSLKSSNVAHKTYSRQAEKSTSVTHKVCLLQAGKPTNVRP